MRRIPLGLKKGKVSRLYVGVMDDMLTCHRTEEKVSFIQCSKCEHFFNRRGYRLIEQGQLDRIDITGIECTYRTDEDKASEERMNKILNDHICPDCNTKLIVRTVESGSHKGHGSYACPTCKEVKVWI